MLNAEQKGIILLKPLNASAITYATTFLATPQTISKLINSYLLQVRACMEQNSNGWNVFAR